MNFDFEKKFLSYNNLTISIAYTIKVLYDKLTYLIGHYNPAFKITTYTVTSLMYVVCVNFIHEGLTYGFKSPPNNRL